MGYLVRLDEEMLSLPAAGVRARPLAKLAAGEVRTRLGNLSRHMLKDAASGAQSAMTFTLILRAHLVRPRCMVLLCLPGQFWRAAVESAAQEANILMHILPLILAKQDKRWNPILTATDASLSGYSLSEMCLGSAGCRLWVSGMRSGDITDVVEGFLLK